MTQEGQLPTTPTLDATSASKQRSAEAAMRATIIKSTAVAVPIAIAIFIGIVALALRSQQPPWTPYLVVAIGLGVIAGVFFGITIGVTLTSHNFE
jgi:hypothetical protein